MDFPMPVHGIFHARTLEGVAFPFSRGPSQPRDQIQVWIDPQFNPLQVDSLPAEPQGKSKNTGVGGLALLQGIFLIQESNRGLLHCRQILYQLRYQGTPGTIIKRPAQAKEGPEITQKATVTDQSRVRSSFYLVSVSLQLKIFVTEASEHKGSCHGSAYPAIHRLSQSPCPPWIFGLSFWDFRIISEWGGAAQLTETILHIHTKAKVTLMNERASCRGQSPSRLCCLQLKTQSSPSALQACPSTWLFVMLLPMSPNQTLPHLQGFQLLLSSSS